MAARNVSPSRRSRPSKPLLVLLAAAALLLPVPESAHSQTADGERVREFIDGTAELLELAAGVVDESESARARIVLKEAVDLHERSLQWVQAERYLLAWQLSDRAREVARHAVQLARESQGFENQARHRLERFRERRDQVLDRAYQAENERALGFVREAEKQALRAEEQFAQNNFALALQLIDAADALLTRAARLVLEGGSLERLGVELDRTAELIARTQERLAERPQPEAARLLDEARSALERAREHVARREPARAHHAAEMARELAQRAAALLGGGPDRAAVQAQIDRWDARQDAIAARVQTAGDAARKVYERAVQHRARAAELLGAGDAESALRQIKVAHDLLTEAGERAR
jgi:hypothetical protein